MLLMLLFSVLCGNSAKADVHSIDPYAYIAINDVADIFPATNLNDLKGETKLEDTGDSDDTE